MASSIGFVLWWITLYSFALLNYVLYLGIAVRNGTFFRRSTEREKNELLLARDHYWNLSHSVFELYHRFFVLRNGRQLHYFTNAATANASTPQSKNLVIFLHGFPDSSLLWRYVVESSILRQNATLVAVDLPGFGGSDSLPRYSASDVLESLTEFIVAMRERYLGTNDADSGQGEDPTDKVFIVGHDWGCLLGYRLAAEAPSLAHRFILTNAPHVSLALSNKDRILTASKKMVMTILHAPLTNYHCFHKVLDEMRPLVYQILLFGYIAAFQLPAVMVKYLGVVGNYAFIRLVHKSENRIDKADYNAQHSLAMTMGPGEAECRTATDGDTPEKYSDSVLGRAKESGAWFLNCTAYYRDGAAFDKWEKSIDTLGALYNLEIDDEKPMKSKYGRKRRNSSASSALFSDICASSLKAPATIIWGRKDQACTEAICLDGIGDYLARDSQVLMLPKSGHWTPIEKASRETLRAVLERLIQTGDVQKKDLQAIAKETYPNASVGIEK